jgi:hypothetical protein
MRMKTLLAITAVLTSVAWFASCTETKPEELSYISGTVYEKITKAPISDAVLTLGDTSVNTAQDGRFIFTRLEKGSKNDISCFKNKFKSFKISDVVAVYPSTTQDIELEIEVPDQPSPSPIKSITTKNLKSFDYVLNFGITANQITYEMNGSFLAPNSYSHSMKQFRQQQVQVGPDDAKKESPPVKVIDIAGNQWVDEGNGFMQVDKEHMRGGFKDMFDIIETDCQYLSQAFAQVKNSSTGDTASIGGVNCKRYTGLVSFELDRIVPGKKETRVKDLVLCDYSVAVATDKEIEGVPVDVEVTLYYNQIQIKTYTHFTLSNINKPIVIKAPEVKGPTQKIEITPNP